MSRRLIVVVVLAGSIIAGSFRVASVLAQVPAGRQPIPQGPPPQNSVARNGPTAASPRLGGVPAWFPLAPEQEKRLNDVLKYWEFRAGQVQRYRCQFTRWEYDPVTLPRHPNVAAEQAQGTIQYAAPDKGLFKVEKLWYVAIDQQANPPAPLMKDHRPQYTAETQIVGDHWICDGKSVFEFDSLNKQLKQRHLPPDMQGKQIADGPLPFLFGAKMQTIKDRYWIRVLDPPPVPGCFTLQAFPKRREDAANYRELHVVIDEKEFLPMALLKFEINGARTTYEFANRETNWNLLTENLNPFHSQFYAPKTPAGWKRIVEPFQPEAEQGPPAVASPPAGPQPPPRQATRPVPKKSS